MIQELIHLLGYPINSPEVKVFLESRNIKYPKKDTYSTQAVSINCPYINDKKAKITLEFKAGMWNPKYPVAPAERGGNFYFRLGVIDVDVNNQELLDLLKIPSPQISLDELFKILGERKKNTHNRYSWIIPINAEKDVCATIYYDNEEEEIGLLSLVVPQRPLISQFSNEGFGNIIGKAINSPEIKAFIEKHHGVYPKKDTIDTSIDPSTVKADVRSETEGQYFSIYVAGGGIKLTFGLKEKTEKYFPLPAKKANHYYPILNEISICDFYSFKDEDNPMGVTSTNLIETMMIKWGKPFEVHENYCWWKVPCDTDEEVVMDVFYSTEKGSTFFNEFYHANKLRISLNAKK